MHNNALDVCQVLVVLERLGAKATHVRLRRSEPSNATYPLKETSLLRKVRDPRAIVVGEHLVAENGIGDLRSVDQVHLEQPGLEVGLLGLVILERIKEERRRLLDHVLGHEDIHNALDIDEWAVFVVHQLHRELGTLLGVRPHDVLQKRGVVGGEADLLRVQHDLLELSGLGEACNDLVRDVGAQVDGQRESHVMQTNNITKLFGALKLGIADFRHERQKCTLK